MRKFTVFLFAKTGIWEDEASPAISLLIKTAKRRLEANGPDTALKGRKGDPLVSKPKPGD